MISSTDGRFNQIWWGIWDHYINPLQPENILDLGTGPALLLPKLRKRYPSAALTGLEIQPEMLESARTVVAQCGAKLIESDLASPIPLPSDHYDVLTIVMVLHELLYPPAMLKEACRVLKPGGRMLIYDWVKRPLRSYMDGKEMSPDDLNHFKEHCLFSPDDIIYLLESSGLKCIESIGRRNGNFCIFVVEKVEKA
jgi:ubiquinone/menaquinone biosynthesis C-methylase UbiE